jgi:hypothetical protein
MKLTRQELVNLVKEEMAHPRGDLGKTITDADFPILVGYEGVSEIAYNRDELDQILDTVADQGLAYSLDSLADVEVQDLPAGARIEMMEKITISKSRLSKMIKKSVKEIIREQVVGYQPPTKKEKESDNYLTTGSTSMAAKPDSQEEEGAADSSTRELTQQRQSQLDQDDAVTADDTGRQLQDLLNQKNEGRMKISSRQLRRIIRESILSEQKSANFQSNHQGYHPLFASSYAGNGYQPRIFEPVRSTMVRALESGDSEGIEYYKVLLNIMDEKGGMPPYVPFNFADDLMNYLDQDGAQPSDIQELDMEMADDDNEYLVAYTDW